MIKIISKHSESDSYYIIEIFYIFTISFGFWMFETSVRNISIFVAFSILDICLTFEFETNQRGAIQLSARLDMMH